MTLAILNENIHLKKNTCKKEQYETKEESREFSLVWGMVRGVRFASRQFLTQFLGQGQA